MAWRPQGDYPLPPAYVRPYVRGNKTDLGDCAAILEAARNSDIRPVPAATRAHERWSMTDTSSPSTEGFATSA
jgi:hypothetical protein